MKAVLVIADGMADRPVRELGWKTPLEVAHKPSLDHIARSGVCGIIDPISPGMPPGSDTATLALLGYDALKVYTGRGALEALGCGMEILPGDVAFRCNFATTDEKLVVLDRRAGRVANKDANRLAEALQSAKLKKNPNASFIFQNTIQHRAVLVLRGPKLSTAVSDSDPGTVGERILPAKPLNASPEARLTAQIVNELTSISHKILIGHPINKERVRRGLQPANMILCRGAGTIPKITPFSLIYGVRAACVAATPLVRGVCKAAGIEVVSVKGATGTPQTDYAAKVRAVSEALKRCDFVLLHVKAADVASHDRNVKQKVEVIEKIDDLLGNLVDEIDMHSTYVAITADHTTSLVTGNHEGDPVPLTISGPYVRRDDIEKFDERSCARGGLNRIRGVDLMPLLMNLLGKVAKFGA